jgi:hypothetical protein
MGVAPGTAGAGVMEMAVTVVMMMVVVGMPVGLGRSFGDPAAEHESCGENSDRSTRLGCIPECDFFQC